MALNFNGIAAEDAKDLICLSDVPNIVTLADDAGGTYGEFYFVFNNPAGGT